MSANAAAPRVDERQQLRSFGTQVDLVERQDTGLRDLHQDVHQIAVAAAGAARWRRPRPDDVDLAHRLQRRIHHPHVHAVQRAMDARRVDEHDLPLGEVRTPVMRLRVVCGLSETMASLVSDQTVEQGGLAGVRAADQRDEPALHP
jgi:hypothetical protein